MHYYQFNLGDYYSHTGHLTEMEDLAYRRMLDWCYLHEKALPMDVEEIARLIRMRTHCDAIRTALLEFFDKTENGYVSSRVNAELSRVSDKSSKARASAQVRWAKENKDLPETDHPMRTHSERNAKRMANAMLPKTQDPIPNTQDLKTKTMGPPNGVSLEVWNSFVAQRKMLKAVITPTAINRIALEAAKIGWTLQRALEEISARGWRGFKADWVKIDSAPPGSVPGAFSNGSHNPKSTLEQKNLSAVENWVPPEMRTHS